MSRRVGTLETASLSSQLRDFGQMDGKYVPRPYLEAGVGQRLALLQGLMDTDGYVDDVAGRCEFTSINEGLADAVVELAASLGFRPVKTEGRATFAGVDKGRSTASSSRLTGRYSG